METPQVLAAVIVLHGSGILLGKDTVTGKWTLPKSIVPKFEPLEDTARMAVAGASGLAVDVTSSIFISQEIVPPNEHTIVVVTLGKLTGDAAVTHLDPAYSEIRWVDFRELGTIQDDIDDITADAIMKLGTYMQAKARGV